MRRIAYLTLYWHPQSPEERLQIRQRVEEWLRRHKLKARGFPEDRDFCRLVPLDASSKKFDVLLQELEEWTEIDDVNLKIWHTFNERELSSAPLLLWGPTNQAIEDDWYDLEEDGYQGGPKASHKRCPACRAELEQVRDLLVDVRKMGKRDLSLTYSFEIILSSRLARMVQEAGFSGIALRPVWHYRRPHQGEPPLYQLVVTNILPPMASPPTEFEHEQRCEVCGTETKFIKHTHWWGRIKYYEETDIYYSKSVLEGVTDFNVTWEKIGDLPSWSRLVIITQRVYRWLREWGVRGWSVKPVYLVD